MRRAAAAASLLLSGAAAAAPGCSEYYGNETSAPARWCREGDYFWFRSPTGNNNGSAIPLFYHCSGDPASARVPVLFAHGYPTSSFDLADVVAALAPELAARELSVCAVDMAGFGFSAKPRAPWTYSIFDHAAALVDFATRVVPHERFALWTHDEGDSVGLRLLAQWLDATPPARPFSVTHHLVMNGNVYLPLAKLTPGQQLLRSNRTGPVLESVLPSALLAEGLAHSAYSPPLSRARAEELRGIFDFEDGTAVMHETIHYLDERAEHEDAWLDAWSRMPVACSLLWGEMDEVAPVAVADFVWQRVLANGTRPAAPATYATLPPANHYLHVDHARDVAAWVRRELQLQPV